MENGHKITRVMFVCHGNICRSPMAEFISRNLAAQMGLAVTFASSATSTEEIRNGVGNPVYPPAQRELKKHGIACDGHEARQITQADYDHFDHIYYMDRSNLRYLKQMFPRDNGKIQPFLDRDVADPWYSGDFTQTWLDVTEGCNRLLEEFL